MKQKGVPVRQAGLTLILTILLIILGSYLIYQKQFKPVPLPQQTSQPSPTASSIADYCNYKTRGGSTVRVKDCGDFKVLAQSCCDFPDIILDKNGNQIGECGGLVGYSDECKKRFLPQTNCAVTQCKRY